MKKVFRFNLFVFGFMLMTCSTVLVAQPASKQSLNQIMSGIGSEMSALFPLVLADRTLTTAENEAILDSVNTLQALFDQAEPFIRQKSPTYLLSFQLLQDYLESIIDDVNPLNLEPVRQRLRVLSDFCVSCHTQDDKFRTLFKKSELSIFDGLLTYAEFNYATRNYLEAQAYYEKYLLFTPSLSDKEMLKPLHRILSIHTQILNQPLDAISALSKLEEGISYQEDIKNYVQGAKAALSNLNNDAMVKKSTLSYFELSKSVAKILSGVNASQPIIVTSPQEEVDRLWLRGALFRYLNQNPKPDEIPSILYWLALCDRSLGYGYDYTLADFYIRQCIVKYPEHPFARRCYNEYEAYVKYFYITPTEPVLPVEISKELKSLKAVLDKKK